ncbi:MAG: hypothetical protein ACI8WB_001331 [Phenylobacterium sp.]|jgi:hypothetical protein
MKKATKAVLWSALLYPGAGHFILKKYPACIVLVMCFSLPLFLVISEIVDKTNQLVARITNGEILLDVAAISKAVTQMTSSTEAEGLNVKIYIMIIVWIVAILDAYRIGREDR